MGLWESHRDLVESFASSSISDRTLDLDAWKNTGKEEGEEESINHRTVLMSVLSYDMVLDDPNP